ncbi:MAG: hypothetical protein ACTS6P_01975 [Candidatus Hodgkinia cicadicola]
MIPPFESITKSTSANPNLSHLCGRSSRNLPTHDLILRIYGRNNSIVTFFRRPLRVTKPAAPAAVPAEDTTTLRSEGRPTTEPAPAGKTRRPKLPANYNPPNQSAPVSANKPNLRRAPPTIPSRVNLTNLIPTAVPGGSPSINSAVANAT